MLTGDSCISMARPVSSRSPTARCFPFGVVDFRNRLLARVKTNLGCSPRQVSGTDLAIWFRTEQRSRPLFTKAGLMMNTDVSRSGTGVSQAHRRVTASCSRRPRVHLEKRHARQVTSGFLKRKAAPCGWTRDKAAACLDGVASGSTVAFRARFDRLPLRTVPLTPCS
jgi:hypothetical protein